MTAMKLEVEGMTGDACIRRVELGLRQLPSVHVQHVAIGHVDLEYDPDVTTTTAVRQTLSKLGYLATLLPSHSPHAPYDAAQPPASNPPQD